MKKTKWAFQRFLSIKEKIGICDFCKKVGFRPHMVERFRGGKASTSTFQEITFFHKKCFKRWSNGH